MPVVHDLGGHGFAVLLPANNRVLISHLDFGWRRGRDHVLKLLPGCLGVWDPYVHTSSRCLVPSRPAPSPPPRLAPRTVVSAFLRLLLIISRLPQGPVRVLVVPSSS